MRLLRKTKDGFQVQTALERAEKRLEEAIELAKSENRQDKVDNIETKEVVEDAMLEFKNVTASKDGEVEEKYTTNISGNKKALLDSILGKDVFHDTEEIELDEGLLNEEFHSGYDSLNKVATFNNAVNSKRKESLENSIINESEEYELNSFNEVNVFDGDTYEPEDIMPTNYYLSSFDDENENDIEPYKENESLILGESIPVERVEDRDTEGSAYSNEKVQDKISKNENEKAQDELRSQELIEKVQKETEQILEKAKKDAQLIVENAHKEAQNIIDKEVGQAIAEASEKGYSEGFQKGENEGFVAAENAVNEGMIQEAEAFKNELLLEIEAFNKRKDEILNQNLNELTDLAINVAEKIIKISLKSSKDVVAKMIVSAAEDCRNKEWAKVYISHEDKAIAMNLEKDLVDALNQISSNVRVIVMEDEPSGTCIIETPDQIVDTSVGPQLQNVKQIVKDNRQ